MYFIHNGKRLNLLVLNNVFNAIKCIQLYRFRFCCFFKSTPSLFSNVQNQRTPFKIFLSSNLVLLPVSDMVEEEIVPRYSWSRQGNAIIMLGEHRFKKRSKHRNQRQECHWVCNKCDKGCKAKLTTLNDAIIKIYNIHDHAGFRKIK